MGSSNVDCFNQPIGEFEDLFFSLLSNNYTYTSGFNYIIEGNGEEQTLTLTNPNNDAITYSKTNTDAILFQTWYLETITESGLTYDISSTNSLQLI